MSAIPAEIVTERLRLARVAREHADAILAGAAPEGLALADGYPGEFSLEVMGMVAAAAGGEVHAFGPYFMHRASDGVVIGEIGGILDPEGTVQVGYSIVEPEWNNGYATEALAGLIAHVRTDGRATRFIAETLTDRPASRRVLEKAGLELVAERDDIVDGEPAHVLTFELEPGNFGDRT